MFFIIVLTKAKYYSSFKPKTDSHIFSCNPLSEMLSDYTVHEDITPPQGP